MAHHGLQALHDAREEAAREIAAALQPILPVDFRGRITIVVDKGRVRAQDISIELRTIQQ